MRSNDSDQLSKYGGMHSDTVGRKRSTAAFIWALVTAILFLCSLLLVALIPFDSQKSVTKIPDERLPAETEAINSSERVQKNEDFASQSSWYNAKCKSKCHRNDIDVPPLLVISLDGFSKTYTSKGIVKTLDKIAKCGATAQWMYPPFPSKTFPSHYTMATGLYPQVHGIAGNTVRASEISPKLVDVRRTNDSRYFGGEPIWNVAEKSGRRAACLFWAGCNFNVNGVKITYNVRYNSKMQLKTRVNQVIEWLALPKDKRPSLVMLYLNEPDKTAHWHQMDTDVEVEMMLMELDRLLEYLLSRLHHMRLLDCMNIVIVSDHGMQTIKRRFYVKELLNTSGLLVAYGVVSRIFKDAPDVPVEDILNTLKCANNGTDFRIYDNARMPVRYHYSGSERIGDIVLEGMAGNTFEKQRGGRQGVLADHGYDFLLETMHGIFYARGPSIAKKKTLRPFQNVELFNLMLELLEIDVDVPNNGTRGVLNEALADGRRRGKVPRKTDFKRAPLRDCGTSPNHGNRSDRIHKCERFLPSSIVEVEETSNLSTCRLCFTDDENSNYHMTISRTEQTESVMAVVEEVTAKVEKEPDDSLFRKNVFLNEDSAILQIMSIMVNGPFLSLQRLTAAYAKRYVRLLTVTGPVYDYNYDGRADSAEEVCKRRHVPTHIFRILIRCDSGQWRLDGRLCENPEALRTLVFILPNVEEDFNCLDPTEYLMANAARIRDVELLTHLRFFADRRFWNETFAASVRTAFTLTLWPL